MNRTPLALKAPQAPSLRALALAIGLTLLPCIGAQVAWAQSGSREPVTLNFVDAEIEAVARTMATISGRNVVVDPRVKGAISLATDRPVSPAAALNQFGAALRLQGFTLVDTGGLYKIVPEADGKLQGNPVNAGPVSKLRSSNQIVTQIFNLSHESANNLVPILRPLIGPNNTINVNPGTNALVITDYADNLQRIGSIISALDVAGASDVEVIPLQHALAADLVPMVSRLLDQPAAGAGGQGDPSYKTTLVAEPRSNAIVMRAANPARLALVRSLVIKLDQPSSIDASGNIHVVYLKNADAVSLATTLRAAMASEGASVSGGASISASAIAPTQRTATAAGNQAAAPVASVASPSTGGQIQADPATNSLIITAPEPQYRQLRAVIDKLDSRRAQVYVESLIAEVNADKASEFGIQWQSPIGNIGSSVVGLLGTNFGTAGNNILTNLLPVATGDTAGITAPGTGFNLGLAQQRNGVYLLGLLARFLQTSGEGNVLSTPNLLTLDNQEAKIVVGQNVPFVTGQFTNTGSGSNNGTVNPFQTIERKDVGITLRVKPQISENGTIKMTIYQEVSAVQASSLNSPSGIITTQRTIESTVLVEDGGVIVLGGLLQDEFSGNQDKIPGLGDVPIFGNLFKNETRTRKKTNLMVFLRPVILRDASATNALSLDRYDLMRGAQKEAQPEPSQMLRINDAPVLPPQRAPVYDAVPTIPAGN